MSGKKVFILGPGFIGWSILDLLVKEGYSVTGYVRRQEHADALKASGAAEVVLGDLNEKSKITKYAAAHDILFHTATADHLPSVEALLDAAKQRAAQGLETIYIHTSGTSLISDHEAGSGPSSKIFRDSNPSEIDSLPDSAHHRSIDLAIIAAQKQLGDKAKVAIMIPPLIYGCNPKHGRLSIQVPTLTRYALKHGFAGYIGEGGGRWSTIHVLDLAEAYVTLLHHLESTPASSPDIAENPYYFCENTGDDEPSWKDIATVVGAKLKETGHVAEAAPRSIPPDTYVDVMGDFSASVVGLNSRSRADRLRKLGWTPVEKSWKESLVEDEIPAILSEKTDHKAFRGYGASAAS